MTPERIPLGGRSVFSFFWSATFLDAAHKHAFRNRGEISASTMCGCFWCLSTYPPSEIVQWTDADEMGVGQTALCPRCPVDSVIGDASGLPMKRRFLRAMRRRFFGS